VRLAFSICTRGSRRCLSFGDTRECHLHFDQFVRSEYQVATQGIRDFEREMLINHSSMLKYGEKAGDS
jgi:hypothetical protein